MFPTSRGIVSLGGHRAVESKLKERVGHSMSQCRICGDEISEEQCHDTQRPSGECICDGSACEAAQQRIEMGVHWPKKIYLQVLDEDGEIPDEVTWCEDRLYVTDIKYVCAEVQIDLDTIYQQTQKRGLER